MITLGPGVRLQDGRYCLEELLGAGGFSSVYRARDALLRETVAVKALNLTAVDGGSGLERVLVEAKATMIHLRHPRIVGTYDLFQEQNRFFIAMEYLAGGSLQQKIVPARGLALDDAIRVMTDVCEGLSYAHEKGIVHCDIKPGNILFDHQGRAKLADFGIAHISRVHLPQTARRPSRQYNLASIHSLIRDALMATEITRFCQERPAFLPVLEYFGLRFSLADMIDTLIEYSRTRMLLDALLAEIQAINPRQYGRYEGQLYWDAAPARGEGEPGGTSQESSLDAVVGTLPYMAPEQVEGVRDDPCVDVYALGVVLYQLVTGQFYLDFDPREKPEARTQNMWLIKSQPPRPLRGVPSWLARVILQSLAKDRRRRFPTAAEMRAALLEGPRPAVTQQRQRLDRERQVRNYTDWGTSALNDGDYAEAIAHFSRGLELDPGNEKLKRLLVVAGHRRDSGLSLRSQDVRRTVRAYISMGESALRAQALEDAIRYFEEALKLEPDNEKARRYLAIALHRRREGAGALAASSEASSLNLWLQRGEQALQAGRYDEAIHCFGEALEIDPDHYQAADLLTQARIARKRGRR